jgi:hypothetical protein
VRFSRGAQQRQSEIDGARSSTARNQWRYHLPPMGDGRITWEHGERRAGPNETIGVLELRADGTCRAVFAERVEVDGRCHVLLARKAWGGKASLDTRWWSLVLDRQLKVETIRNGSCGDALTRADVPRIIQALTELDLITGETTIACDDGPPVIMRLVNSTPTPTPMR